MSIFKEKTTQSILEEIQSKATAHDRAIQEARAAIDNAQGELESAQASMEAAADVNDSVAFSKAKKQMAEAQTALEMAELRKSRLVEKGAVSKNEADAAIRFFDQQIRQIDIDAAVKITAHLEQIFTILKDVKTQNLAVGSQYMKLVKCLDREAPADVRTGISSRTYKALNNPINLARGRSVGNLGLKNLYDIAGK